MTEERRDRLAALERRLAALAACQAGVQLAWALVTAHGTPLALSCGVSRRALALARLPGPLSGLVVQPAVGAASDAQGGERRVLLAVGGALAAAGLAALFRAAAAGGLAFVEAGLTLVGLGVNVANPMLRAAAADAVPRAKQADANAALAAALAGGQLVAYAISAVHVSDRMRVPGVPPGQDDALALLIGVPVVSAATVASLAALRGGGRAAGEDDGRAEEPLLPDEETDEEETDEREGAARKDGDAAAAGWVLARLAPVVFTCWLAWFAFLLFATHWLAEAAFDGDAHARDGTPGWVRYERGKRWANAALATNAVVMFASSGVVPRAARAVGTRGTLVASLILQAGLLGLTRLVGHGDHWLGFWIIALLGAPWAVTQSLPNAIVAASAPASQRGTLTGALNVFVVSAQFAVLGVIGLLDLPPDVLLPAGGGAALLAALLARVLL